MSTDSSCLFCDSTDDLEEHHVVPRQYGGTDSDENLITVCEDCHKTIERTWGQRFYDRIGVRADMTPNMMFDALKEIRRALQETRAAVAGARTHYESRLESVPDTTVGDYGGTVTKRQVVAIKLEAYQELLSGEWYDGVIALDELADLETYSYRVLEQFEDGDQT